MLGWIEANSQQQNFVRRNFIANWMDGAFYAFAMSFVSLSTVLPLFVKKIGGGNIAVGLIPVFWTIGFNFPQIFMSNYARQLPFKKALVLKTALLQRLPWLLLAIFSFCWIGRTNPISGLMLFFFGFGLAAITGSLNMPAWFDLVAKVIPVKLRGRLFSARAILGALLGIFGGWVVNRVLISVAYPHSFALLFALAFLVMMISYIFITRIKEEHPNSHNMRTRNRLYLRQLPVIVRQENNFRNFLFANALLTMALMAEAFYALNALTKFNLSDAYAGTFTMIMMGSIIAGNLLFGWLADQFGHRLNMVLASAAAVVACSIALVAGSVIAYSFVFVTAAFTAALLQTSRLPIIAEICGERDRPTYVALSNMLSAPFSLSGILGGWLANRFGYPAVFAVGGMFALCSLIWWLAMVQEPRKNATQTRLMNP